MGALRNGCTHVDIIIHKIHKMGTTQASTDEWISKQNVVHICTKKFFLTFWEDRNQMQCFIHSGQALQHWLTACTTEYYSVFKTK